MYLAAEFYCNGAQGMKCCCLDHVDFFTAQPGDKFFIVYSDNMNKYVVGVDPAYLLQAIDPKKRLR